MTRALGAQGVEADIVTTNDNGAALLPVETGSMLDHAETRVCFLPRWSPGVAALREFQYAAAFSPWLRAALPNYDGLHVHAVFSYVSTRAMMIARATGVPASEIPPSNSASPSSSPSSSTATAPRATTGGVVIRSASFALASSQAR